MSKFKNNFFIDKADALVSLGLADLGYKTLTIDDRYWKHTKALVTGLATKLLNVDVQQRR